MQRIRLNQQVLGGALASILILGPMHQAEAVLFDFVPAVGNWNNGANWNQAGATPGAADDVNIGAGRTTAVDGSFSINAYTGAGNTTIETGRRLSLGANSVNDGEIALADLQSSSVNSATLDLRNTAVSLTGTGRILIATGNQNLITGSTGGSLILGSQQSLDVDAGARGEVRAGLANQGDVNVSGGGTLTMSTTAKSNTGTIDIQGDLNVQSISLDNTGGNINIGAAGNLNLSSSTLTGGNVTGTGDIEIGGTSIFDGVSVAGGVDTNIGTSERLTMTGSNTFDGRVELNDTQSSSVNAAILNFDGATLGGTGQIEFVSGNQNLITATGLTTLTSGLTIKTTGAGTRGEIRAELVNEGLISVDGGTIELETANKTNSNRIEVLNGGVLDVIGIDINNAGGVIDIAPSGEMNLNSATIAGGTIQGGGTVDVNGASTLDGIGMTLDNLRILVGTSESLRLVGSIENNSTIELADLQSSSVNAAILNYDGSSPTGTGEIVFKTAHQNLINATAPMTLTAGQTIRTDGAIAGTKGEIRAEMTNEGLISANNGIIDLETTNKTNTARIEVLNSGTLNVNSINVANTSGVIDVEAGSVMNLSSSTIAGGTIEGGGDINVAGASTLDGVGMTLNNMRVLVGTSESLRLVGNIENNSTIELADVQSSTVNAAILNYDGSSPTGTGEIVFKTAHQNLITSSGQTTLTAGQTIRTDGAIAGTKGEIRAEMTNEGLISANNGIIDLETANKTNTGRIETLNSGTLNINSITVANTGGVIDVEAGSVMNLSSSTIAGGTIEGGGDINVAGASTLDGVGMTLNNMRVLVGTSESLRLVGNIENNSTIELADVQSSTVNAAVLNYDGSSPTGTGEIVFKTAHQNLITSIGQTTLTSGQTIRTDGAIAGTAGEIRAEMTNEGLIHADNGDIRLSIANKANRNVIRASNNGEVRINSISVDNAGGTFDIDNSSVLVMSGASISGGAITGTGTVEVVSTASWDSVDVGALTTNVGTSESLTLQGNVGHTGTIRLADVQTSTVNASVINVHASGAALSGAGQIQFTTGNQNQIGGTGTLELQNGHEIHALAGARGQIRTQVVNRGVIRANGTIELLNPALLTNTADGVITGDGTLDLNGTLNNDGTITAGNSPGSLFIDGNVDNSSSSTLLIEIDGSGGVGNQGSTYDFIDVSGTFDLAGTLAVDLLSFVPNFADEYFILTASSILGGVDDFLNVAGGIANLGFGTAGVRIDNGTDLVLFNIQLNQTSPVPAPGSLGLLLAGVVVLAVRRRRMTRRG